MFYAGKQVGRIEIVGNKLAIYEDRISKIPMMENDINQLKNMYDTTRSELITIRETLDRHFSLTDDKHDYT